MIMYFTTRRLVLLFEETLCRASKTSSKSGLNLRYCSIPADAIYISGSDARPQLEAHLDPTQVYLKFRIPVTSLFQVVRPAQHMSLQLLLYIKHILSMGMLYSAQTETISTSTPESPHPRKMRLNMLHNGVVYDIWYIATLARLELLFTPD